MIIMKLKLTIPIILIFMGLSMQLLGQRIIKGTVVSEEGEPLIGAAVKVKGAQTGTISDLDGNYSIKAKDGDYLLFSYIGYEEKSVLVEGQTQIDVILSQGVALEEVVVTALGITREKKALGYAVEGVSADDISKSAGGNPVNALRSRVSGVSFQTSSGAPGAATDILIRGITSLNPSSSNRPLYIIDGVEISDDVDVAKTLPTGTVYSGLPTSNATQASVSSRIMDINPDDIESMNILKGAAATSLYGVRAANGVVIINTKKGKAGKPIINAYFGTNWSEVNRYSDIQTQFIDGHRYTGLRRYKARNGVVYHRIWDSWGPTYKEGMDVVPHNIYKEFFQTGRGNNFGASVSAGNEKFNYRLSGNRNYSQGIVPNTNYGSTSFSFGASYKFSDKFTAEGNVRYTKSGGNRPNEGRKSVMNSLYYMSPVAAANKYKDDYTYGTNFSVGITDHPLFLAENINYTDDVDRYISSIKLNYQFTRNLSLNYVVGLDSYSDNRRRTVHPDTDEGQSAVSAAPYGFLVENTINRNAITSNLYARWQNNLTKDISLSATLGHYLYSSNRKYLSVTGSRLVIPEFYNLNNAIELEQSNSVLRYRNMAIYGELTAGYDNYLYLTFTGRNDFSSSLPVENRSYFFPSASLSLVLSEMFDLPKFVSFAKLRSSYSVVGKDASPYKLGRYYFEYSGIPSDEIVAYKQSSLIGNANLKPEFTKSLELGGELSFFNNRLGVDVSYYDNKLNNMILSVPIANSTGASSYYTNAGSIENKGWEVMLFGDLVKNDNFRWNTSVNWSTNKGYVKEIHADVSEIIVGQARNVTNKYVIGGKIGDLYGVPFNRTDDGELIIAENGYPYLNLDTTVLMGNAMPDFVAGLTNEFNYKGFGLSFLLEWKKGGKVIDVGRPYQRDNGNVEATNNRWEKAVFKGVVEVVDEDGNVVSYEPNTKEVEINARYWYRNASTARYAPEIMLKDASWFRIRNISLSYDLTNKVLKMPYFDNLRIIFSVDNVYLNTPYPSWDPETNYFGSDSNVYGFTGLRIPATRTYSLKFNFTFK